MRNRTDYITRGKLGDITFQLNPTEVTHDDGAVWGEINSPGMKRPISNYSYGKAGTYSFVLYFNQKHTRQVNLTAVRKKLQEYRTGKKPVLFTYMGNTGKVLVIDCSFQILSMNAKLQPTEMNATITLKEYYS